VRGFGSGRYYLDRIEAIRGLLGSMKSGKSVQIPGRFVAERSFNRLLIRQLGETTKEFDYMLPIPGTVHIPELGLTFRAEIADGAMVPDVSRNEDRVFVDGGRLGPCVKIRLGSPEIITNLWAGQAESLRSSFSGRGFQGVNEATGLSLSATPL
jgi:hypothetical protein